MRCWELSAEAEGMQRAAPPNSLGSGLVKARPEAASSAILHVSFFFHPSILISNYLAALPGTWAHRGGTLEVGEGPSPAVPAGNPQSDPVPGSSVLRLAVPPALGCSQAVARTHPAGSWGLCQSGGRSCQSGPNLVGWGKEGERMALLGALELWHFYEKRIPKLRVWKPIFLKPLPYPRKSPLNMSSECSHKPLSNVSSQRELVPS